jgi:hypothetical protein
MKKLILSAIVSAVASVSIAHASPLVVLQTINFDAPGGLGSTNYAGPGADTTLTPLTSGTPEYWNPIAFSGTTAAGLASDGITPTTVTFSDGSDGHFDYGTPSPISLYDPYDYNHAGGPLTESLNNLAAGTYNLFIYSQNGGFADRGGVFVLNSITQTVTNDGTDHSTFILGTNYTEYTGIVLSAPGSITFTYGPVTEGEGDINGVQLQVLGVPEPSTWAMLLGGAAVLLFIQRRRANAKV